MAELPSITDNKLFFFIIVLYYTFNRYLINITCINSKLKSITLNELFYYSFIIVCYYTFDNTYP